LVGIGLALPAGASAAGGPVPAVQGGRGVGLTGSPFRYVARSAGHGTVVERVTTGPRRVQSQIRVAGRYGVPGADFSGATTGLSADGRTLVLEPVWPYVPPPQTRLLVLNTRPLRIRQTITLPGWSVVDAISPNGRWLYLLHYRSSNITRYEVLAYDVLAHRLLSKPIVDPHDRGEAMTGIPISRLMGPGGRWAYTLYFRPSGRPFVHALDTSGVRAVCIDLRHVSEANWSASLHLNSGATTLRVILGGATLAAIDTRTFSVSSVRAAAAPALPVAPARERPPAAAHNKRSGAGGGMPAGLIVLLIAALAGVGVVFWRRARRRPPKQSPISAT
jgi:hypothetical protein